GAGNVGTETAPVVTGLIWLDRAERWDLRTGNGNPAGTVDFFTVMAHETGHALGLSDAEAGLMAAAYGGERPASAISEALAAARPLYMPLVSPDGNGVTAVPLGTQSQILDAQLKAGQVRDILDFASKVSASNDAIIAIVDRSGNILGVRVEQKVLDTIQDPTTLVFAIDGAVAKARTAAFFSNGDPTNVDQHSPFGTFAPITSRLVRFISQSTVTEREVESNPNVTDPNSTIRGPGFVAPIGLGAHFPPEIPNTPPVDLFGIEHTNRDSLIHPGDDAIKNTADDFQLRGRFNIDPAFVPVGKELPPPESYGTVSGLLPRAQSRGIATLPGGVPLFRDTTGDGVGDTLIGGIGVFFPGPDGFATHEQGFVPGVGQTEFERTNAPKVLEAEVIAAFAAGGSKIANIDVPGLKLPGHPVPDLDIPFGRLDLVGIELQALGPAAGNKGLEKLVDFAREDLSLFGAASGQDLQVTPAGTKYLPGTPVPEGWLVLPHDSKVDPITAADVERIINEGIATATEVRAAIRLDAGDISPGARTRMVLAVTDTSGEVLGLYRMKDATVFSIDVAVAKARNTAYYAD
ncbi:MAG TPA: matrixin family metalloprotease, partial [Planctomycetaceae bacterium]